MKKLILLFVILSTGLVGFCQYTHYERLCTQPELTYITESDIQYYSEQVNAGDKDKREKCRLDVYNLERVKVFSTIFWFQGVGLTGGDNTQEYPYLLKENGYMARMMKINGYAETYLNELQGFDHEMEEPASFLILEFIYKTCQMKNKLRKPGELIINNKQSIFL